MRRLLLFGTVLASVAVGAFFLTRWVVDQTGAPGAGPAPESAIAAPAPTISPAEFAKFVADLQRRSDEEQKKPRFYGVIGDFLVVAPGEKRQESPCPVTTSHGSGIRPSELNLPGMSEQAVCADGTVVAVCGDPGCREYFLGRAQVVADAPRERLHLLEVDGRPALGIEPPVPEFSDWGLYVIQRAPAGGRPGIVIQVLGPSGGVEAAIERARTIMSR